MNTVEAFAACEETVRRFDPDRYFATLFAPADVRPFLFALYAFNYEIARVGESHREPMIAAIRLQWWREALSEAREGRPRAHPAAIGVAEVLAKTPQAAALLDTMIDAREFDVLPDTLGRLEEFDAYCEATSSGLMRSAALLMASEAIHSDYLRHAGIAYAAAGLLRAIPFHAVRRKLYLPADFLKEECLSPEDIFAGKNVAALKRVIRRIATHAKQHILAARACSPDSKTLRAALPAALSALYLRRVTRDSFDPYRDAFDVALFVRQIALLRAAAFGRL